MSSLNLNGQIVIESLRELNQPASVREITIHIAELFGETAKDIIDVIKETLQGGVRYGYLQKWRSKYYLKRRMIDAIDAKRKEEHHIDNSERNPDDIPSTSKTAASVAVAAGFSSESSKCFSSGSNGTITDNSDVKVSSTLADLSSTPPSKSESFTTNTDVDVLIKPTGHKGSAASNVPHEHTRHIEEHLSNKCSEKRERGQIQECIEQDSHHTRKRSCDDNDSDEQLISGKRRRRQY